MQMHSPYRLAAIACAAIYVLTSLSGQIGRVLCVGENGRAEVEFARAGRCIEAAERDSAHWGAHNVSAVIEYEDSQCGRCVDIPLSAASELTKPSARVSAPDSSFLNGSVESRFAAARAPSGPLLRYEAVRWEGADPVLQSIRAVSLLI